MNIKSVSTVVLSTAIVLGLCQCNQQTTNNTSTVNQEQAPVAVTGLKIAYINVDSLLANYAFYQDLAEEMTRKEENYRLVLLQEKTQKYSVELDTEGAANSQRISESVENYIKEYNKSHGFNLIISKASLLYADETLNITAEVLEGLNAAYKPESK